MPRTLDVAARRDLIVTAAMQLLASGGGKALTIKALADALGGSTTLITHVFQRKEDIYEAVADRVAQEVRDWAGPRQRHPDPRAELRGFLEWCMPLDAGDLNDERLRFAFLERSGHDPAMQELANALDARLREELVERLRPLVPDTELASYTDLLRALTNGAILSVVEHPTSWPAERQLAVVDLILNGSGLSPAPAETHEPSGTPATDDAGAAERGGHRSRS